MKKPALVTRRSFLTHTSGALGSGWMAARWPAFLAAASVACSRDETDTAYKNITPELGDALAAMAEQIIPSSEESPGAREAGVIWFMDAWLGDGGKDDVGMLSEGVRELDGYAGGPGQFVQQDFDQRTRTLKQIEASDFFNQVRFLTLVGMFAMPKHGGNKDRVGWKLVGFKDQHVWQPPFGYYDAEASQAGEGEGV